MKRFRLSATLLSPLMVQEERQSNAPRNLPYLPGATFRGAVAANYLRNGGNPQDSQFKAVFLDCPASFPNLFPTGPDSGSSRPLPSTAHSCKRAPGFESEEGHGVGDSLAALLASEIAGRPFLEPCPVCGQDMKPFQGFWNGDAHAPERYEPVVSYRRHTGIDRRTGTVAESMFYVTQGLAAVKKGRDLDYVRQTLTGDTYLADDQAEILEGWLREPIFAGADRTRGMGEIQVSLSPCDPAAFDLSAWDASFRKKTALLAGREPGPGLFFSIGLSGRAILVDRFLRPTPDLTVDFPGVTPRLRVIRGHTVRGWHSARRLPKTEDAAVEMGGVYLFHYLGDDYAGLSECLRRMVVEGIGVRRPEGFGRIIVCDVIHKMEVI